MQISLKWINNYIKVDMNKDKVNELLEKITLSGLEVSEVEYLKDKFNNIVTAEIIEKVKHPNADSLSVCKISDGEQEYSVVCGAKNHKTNDKVILAKIGAKVLSRGSNEEFEIKKTKLRGEISNGMLCSFEELGLAGDSSGIIILDPNTKIGINAAEALNIDDIIIGIEITANRGDALSHIGVARDISAHTDEELKLPEINIEEENVKVSDIVDVEIKNPENCYRYVAMVVKDVEIKESPEWMQNYLERVGIRPINNVVDITNFVLMEYGQPLHAFDMNFLGKDNNGKTKIIVRNAKKKEEFITLDEEIRKLEENDILICDNEKPVALGGVMGGLHSSVNDNTKNILIESAIFNPVSIRKTAHRVALHTDSSHRFERGIDWEATPIAARRAAELMQKYANGKVLKGRVDICKKEFLKKEVKFKYSYVNNILGSNIEKETMKNILRRLSFIIKDENESGCIVEVPASRNDISKKIDIVEEIARIYGLNKIKNSLPKFHSNMIIDDKKLIIENNIKNKLVAQGFYECICYNFVNSKLENEFVNSDEFRAIKIANPISEDMSVLRRSIIPSLISTLKYNYNRQQRDIKLFELSNIYLSEKDIPESVDNIKEARKLSMLISGNRKQLNVSKRNMDYSSFMYDIYDIKGIIELLAESFDIELSYILNADKTFLNSGCSFKIMHKKEFIGFAGKIDLKTSYDNKLPENTYIAELDYDKLVHHYKRISFKGISKFPSVTRDLALIVPENVLSNDIVQGIYNTKINLIEDVSIFDCFYDLKGYENMKSIGISVVFRSKEDTLSEKKVEKLIKKILKTLEYKFNAKLR